MTLSMAPRNRSSSKSGATSKLVASADQASSAGARENSGKWSLTPASWMPIHSTDHIHATARPLPVVKPSQRAEASAQRRSKNQVGTSHATSFAPVHQAKRHACVLSSSASSQRLSACAAVHNSNTPSIHSASSMPRGGVASDSPGSLWLDSCVMVAPCESRQASENQQFYWWSVRKSRLSA